MGILQLAGLIYIGLSSIAVGVYAIRRGSSHAKWIAAIAMSLNMVIASLIAISL